jgi:hypothetical protein
MPEETKGKARLKVQFAEEVDQVDEVDEVDNEGPPVKVATWLAREDKNNAREVATYGNTDLVLNFFRDDKSTDSREYLDQASIPLLDSVLALATQQEKEERKKRHEKKKKRPPRLSIGEKLDSLNLNYESKKAIAEFNLNYKSSKEKIIQLESKIDESKKAIAELNLNDESLKGEIIQLKSKIADDKKQIISYLNQDNNWRNYVTKTVVEGKVDVVDYDDATLEKFKDDLLAFKNKTIEPDYQKVEGQDQVDWAQGEEEKERLERREILRTILDGWGDLTEGEEKIPQEEFRKFIEKQHRLRNFKKKLMDVQEKAMENVGNKKLLATGDDGKEALTKVTDIENSVVKDQGVHDRKGKIREMIIQILNDWGGLTEKQREEKISQEGLRAVITITYEKVRKLYGEKAKKKRYTNSARGKHKAYEGSLADKEIDKSVNDIFKAEQIAGQKYDLGERKVKKAELVEAAIRANVCNNLFEIHTKLLEGASSSENNKSKKELEVMYKEYASVIDYEEFIDKKNKTLSEKLQDSMDYSNKDFREKAADFKANYPATRDTSLNNVFNLPEKKADTLQELRENLEELKDIKDKNQPLRDQINRENLEQKQAEEAEQMRDSGFSGEKLIEAVTHFWPNETNISKLMDKCLQASYVTDAIEALSKKSDKIYNQKINVAENQLAILLFTAIKEANQDNEAYIESLREKYRDKEMRKALGVDCNDENTAQYVKAFTSPNEQDQLKSPEGKIFYITNQMASLKGADDAEASKIKSKLATLVGDREAERLCRLGKKTLYRASSTLEECNKQMVIDNMNELLNEKQILNKKENIVKYIAAVNDANNEVCQKNSKLWKREDAISKKKKAAVEEFSRMHRSDETFLSKVSKLRDSSDEKSLEELQKLELEVKNKVTALREVLSQPRSFWGSKNTASSKIFEQKFKKDMQR